MLGHSRGPRLGAKKLDIAFELANVAFQRLIQQPEQQRFVDANRTLNFSALTLEKTDDKLHLLFHRALTDPGKIDTDLDAPLECSQQRRADRFGSGANQAYRDGTRRSA